MRDKLHCSFSQAQLHFLELRRSRRKIFLALAFISHTWKDIVFPNIPRHPLVFFPGGLIRE